MADEHPPSAQPIRAHTPDEHSGHGPGRYVLIWAILLVFTGLTVATGTRDLGSANLPIALAIATIKAALVVLFFMHLSESHGANRLVFVVSLVFVLVMMLGVFGDLGTRNPMSLPSGAPAFKDAPQPGEVIGGERNAE